MKIEKMKVSDLKYAPYNPRKIDDKELAKLKRSITEFGYVEPIVWNKRSGFVVGGNQRLKALRELEIEEADVPVLGSPVYMGEISAQAKPFVDRLHPFVHDSSKPLAGKRLVLAYTQGNPNVDIYGKYFEYLEGIFSHVGFDVKCTVAAAGTIGMDDILEQEELLVKAREIGKNL